MGGWPPISNGGVLVTLYNLDDTYYDISEQGSRVDTLEVHYIDFVIFVL